MAPKRAAQKCSTRAEMAVEAERRTKRRHEAPRSPSSSEEREETESIPSSSPPQRLSMTARPVTSGRKINFDFLSSIGLKIGDYIEELGWKNFCTLDEMTYPVLVRRFYENLRIEDSHIESTIKGKRIVVSEEILKRTVELTTEGVKFLVVQSRESCLKNILNRENVEGIKSLHANALTLEMRLLHSFVTTIFLHKTGGFNRVSEKDLCLMDLILDGSPINLPHIIIMQMKETVRRVKTCLPYGMLLTVLFKFYKVDLKNEEGKRLHHTDVYSSNTLMRMGYKKVEGVWRKKSTNERAIGSSSEEEEEEEEDEEEEPAGTSIAPEAQPSTAATGSPFTDLPTADLPEPEIELDEGFGFEGPLPDLPSTTPQPSVGQFQMEEHFRKLSESLTSTMTSLFADFKGSVDNRLYNLEEKVSAIQEKVDRFESSKTAPSTVAPPASLQPIIDTLSSHTKKLQNSVDSTLNLYNEELKELKYKMETFTESVRMEDDYTKGVGIIRSELGRLRGSAEAFANVQAGELISMQKEFGQMKEDIHKIPICFSTMDKRLQSVWTEMISLSGSVRAL